MASFFFERGAAIERLSGTKKQEEALCWI